ncbi:hypothetical protein [Clostridium lundense]|nr:hypothetical protein [Clostridium lundense]
MIQKIFDKFQFVIGFYSTKRYNLERQYTYLKEEDMDKFVA